VRACVCVCVCACVCMYVCVSTLCSKIALYVFVNKLWYPRKNQLNSLLCFVKHFLVPIDLFLNLLVEEFYVPGTKVALFPSYMSGVVFAACVVFFSSQIM